jgi:uncharacterized protein YaiL (DUF2058 family)
MDEEGEDNDDLDGG